MTASSSGHDSIRSVVHVYSYGTSLKELMEKSATKYSKVKIVHFLRHAQGSHNVNKEYQAIHNLDARLTKLGKQQCKNLATTIRHSHPNAQPALYNVLEEAEVVIVSPLTRCIETATLAIQDALHPERTIPFVAHEAIRETVNFNCDRRRNINELKQEFPYVDFSHIENENDELWDSYVKRLGCDETYMDHRETAEIYVVADRARDFFDWLTHRPESNIVVCSHSAFLRCLWNFGQEPSGGECRGKGTIAPQTLDSRREPTNFPVVQFFGAGNDDNDKKAFESSMRRDFENCELRSVVLAFTC